MRSIVFRNFQKKLVAPINESPYEFLFYIILVASFLIRFYNLNYNSAFNDEAIYIVIGRMGVFASDWLSYGANLWMAGQPYIYPVLSALAYHTGGLLASRLLNIIFGTILVEEVYRFTKLINLSDKKTNQKAAIISAFVAGFSGVGIYVSKLATYDIGSFLLMMIAINSFLKAKYFENGKYYFLAFISLILAFLTKIIIAIFFPILIVTSLFIVIRRPPVHRKLAITYFYLPFIIGCLLYFFLNLQNLETYIFTHKDLGLTEGYGDIVELIWKVTKLPLVASLFASTFLLRNKRILPTTMLWILVLTVPLFHLALKRYATLDKHLYLSILFLAPLIGYGLAELTKVRFNKLKYVLGITFAIAGGFYVIHSYKMLLGFQESWQNTYKLESFLRENVKVGDKILTENGGAIILSLYDTLFPPGNIFTFDWIDYSGFQDDRGYTQAMKDLYFDYIELDRQFEGKEKVKDDIRLALKDTYTLVYKEDGFEVYKKAKVK